VRTLLKRINNNNNNMEMWGYGCGPRGMIK